MNCPTGQRVKSENDFKKAKILIAAPFPFIIFFELEGVPKELRAESTEGHVPTVVLKVEYEKSDQVDSGGLYS